MDFRPLKMCFRSLRGVPEKWPGKYYVSSGSYKRMCNVTTSIIPFLYKSNIT